MDNEQIQRTVEGMLAQRVRKLQDAFQASTRISGRVPRPHEYDSEHYSRELNKNLDARLAAVLDVYREAFIAFDITRLSHSSVAPFRAHVVGLADKIVDEYRAEVYKFYERWDREAPDSISTGIDVVRKGNASKLEIFIGQLTTKPQPTSEDEKQFYSLQSAAEGLITEEWDAVDERLGNHFTDYASNYIGEVQPWDAQLFASWFAEALKQRGEAVIQAYSDALKSFGITNPSQKFKDSIRAHVESIIKDQKAAHQGAVEKLFSQWGKRWPDEVNIRAIHNFEVVVSGKLETVLAKDSKPPQKEEKAASSLTAPRPSEAPKNQYRLAAFVAVLGLISLLIQYLILDRNKSDRERRIADQRALAAEITTKLDSCIRLALTIEDFFATDPAVDTVPPNVTRYREALDNLLFAKSFSPRIAVAFNPNLAAQYDSLTHYMGIIPRSVPEWRLKTRRTRLVSWLDAPIRQTVGRIMDFEKSLIAAVGT